MRARVSCLIAPLTPLQHLLARRWRPRWVCQKCCDRQLQWRRSLVSSTAPDASSNKPYYITTPIFYVNADPHVGHMYTMILTDVLKRWQVLKGRKSILCTGTDEHGMKIQQAAAKAGIEPKLFCDGGADVFGDLAARIDISNDIFVRTTDTSHREAVEYAWHMLQDRGYIYESRHEGWYSVSDETFYPQSQVHLIIDPRTGRKIMVSIETGKEVEWTSERNYHFRLTAFRERLLEFYQNNPTFVIPKTRMDEVVQEVSERLEDLSISRPVERLTWGIRVPTDSSQTIYVWLDALLSYASAAGYPFTPGTESECGWPPDVHVVGKDIVRFHCIYWPAFLMALEAPLPRQILTHAHWTLGRQKMAKSTGNVVDPFFALERFGVDAMRWYLVHEGGIADDADYENSYIIEKYKKGLQGGLGNLTSRLLRGKGWDVQKAVREYAQSSHDDSHEKALEAAARISPVNREYYDRLVALPSVVDNHMHDLLPNRALKTIMKAVYDANAHFQQTEPWKLVKQLKSLSEETQHQDHKTSVLAEINHIIFLNAETLRLTGIMLMPFMPTAAARLLNMLGVAVERRNWDYCHVGRDDNYGVSLEGLGEDDRGVLFPGLTSSE